MSSYKLYKDSGLEWIGKIPSHWNMMKLSHLSELTNCGYTSTPEYVNKEDGVVFLSGQNVKNGKIDLWKHNYIKPELHKSLTKHNKPKMGDLLVVRVGGSSNIGMSCVVDIEYEFSIYVSLTHLRLNNKLGHSYFYNYLFNWEKFREFCSVETRFGGGVGNLNVKDFERFKLVNPPLNEQTQIVSFLDTKTQKIDELIEKTEQKIKLLKEKRTSLINHCVTKGLNPDVEMKDSGVEWIGEIPSNYQMVSIKFLVTTPVTDGPHETPVFIDKGIPFLSVNGVVGNKINFNKVRGYISEELHVEYSKKCKPQRDDVLLVKSGSTTGKSTIVETDLDFNIWSPLCIIRSNINKIIPRFTFHTFQSYYFRLLIEDNWSYGTQPNIGMNVIENLSIVVPPISEQTQIVSFLDTKTQKIDYTIDKETQRIKLLKEYRQSLISEVVTGKVDVRDYNG